MLKLNSFVIKVIGKHLRQYQRLQGECWISVACFSPHTYCGDFRGRLQTLKSRWCQQNDPHVNPILYKIIKSNNIHGPCWNINRNSPCMVGDGAERKCSKKFPKNLSADTMNPRTADSVANQLKKMKDWRTIRRRWSLSFEYLKIYWILKYLNT